jgi:tetratricopeptide (TPR) repeat protein
MKTFEAIHKAYELLNNGKENKAWQILSKWESSKHLTIKELYTCKIFEGYLLWLTGNYQKSLKIAEELYQKSKNQNDMLDSLDSLLLICSNLFISGRFIKMEKNLKICENMLKSVLQELSGLEIGWRKANILIMKGYLLYHRNEFDKALKNFNECLSNIKKYKMLSILLPLNLEFIGYVYTEKGELDLALKFHKESLDHSKGNYIEIKIINANSYHDIGEIYFQNGNLDLAILNFEKSLKVWKQLSLPVASQLAIDGLGRVYNSLIKLFVYKNSPAQAQDYLGNFLEDLEERKITKNNYHYQLGKVRVLASSSRTRDQAEAEKILKEFIAQHDALIKAGKVSIPIVLGAGIWYLLICEIYLRELRLTNNLSILNDIKPFIEKLLKESERSNTYTLQAQAYLLHGKVSLLEINMGEARQYLTQAQQIAEDHGLQSLARSISKEHDKVLEQLDEWEELKKKRASISEKMDLASLDLTMDRIQGMRELDLAEMIEEEPILLLIMGEGGISYFNHSFLEGWDDQDLFSAFMSAFNSFSSEFFSKSIDRIKIDENIILFKPVDSFIVCYVIKGQSYPALMKLTRFSDAIKWKPEIWDALNNAAKTNQMLELNKPSALGEVITEIFK